ncbi:MAG: T9SS type A sorting domain-containing protein [Candidatus Cloacimonetes bacterium]|nr:T9SS type A sorting domain-containing protein [Candidatus Cloacimonadota bacterium]
MKKQLIIFAMVLFSVLMLNADNERGLTTKDLNSNELKCVGQIPTYEPSSLEFKEKGSKSNLDTRNWELIDSLNINSFIRAGDHFGAEYNEYDHVLNMVTDQGQLTSEAIAAIEKSPLWIRPDLENIFSQLSDSNQQTWASIINNSEDPYIDEIAFSIAHSSVVYLSSEFSYPELFVENAELIYSTDEDLPYVEVIDYGSSISRDEDYYSTTRYQKINENDELVEVEVPREIYYMYIVFPKITGEIPAYIDPSIIEQNTTHQNNIVDPPTGVFWRNYLYNHNDTGYPLLKDALMQCSTAWDTTLDTDNAIGAITNWVRETLDFTSNYERPHQPVRIYKKHIGRCGEHADFTSAACRTALIPCTSILAMSSDHVWNEFWEERWIAWEPVNNMIDNPLIFENSWGWNFASVFEIRSDGLLTPATATYSEGSATITIYAFDSNGDPIDGAKIMLAVASGTSIYVDNYGYTDIEGKYTFIVGEGRTYYARIDSDIGSIPSEPNQVSLLVENAVDGQTYNNSVDIAGTMPAPDFTAVDAPDDELDDYKLVVDFTVQGQLTHGNIIFDDIDYTEFYAAYDNGLINLFMTDLVHYYSYTCDMPFDTFNFLTDVSEGNAEFDISESEHGSWYVFLDNTNNLNNPQYVTGSMMLYQYGSSGVDVPEIQNINSLSANYPNPFNPETTISFKISSRVLENPTRDFKNTELTIYNIKGQKVKTLVNEQLSAGQHTVIWNGTDDYDKPVSSGIFFYKLKVGSFEQTKKMLMIK